MENPRPEKVAVVTEVKERFEGSPSVLVTEYRGLSVKALAELRRGLRPAGGAYKVYKNTLVRRAAAEAGLDLEEHLLGPTALTFTEQTPEGEPGDIVTVAKVLTDFAKANPDLVIKGGLLDGAPV
ncbi:MAG: 50S ribosomal protein L10, partial [Actinomycetota bacterium]